MAVLPPGPASERESIRREVEEILAGFVRSDSFAVIRKGRCLAREIPCLLPWEEEGIVRSAEGKIDLLWESEEGLYVVDYKTDRLDGKGIRAAAETYRRQGELYAGAVAKALGRPVRAFRVVFLREGRYVDMVI
jgi:ATP-dependent helicase/nuclease subunit A